MNNTQRITISMPENIYKLLIASIGRGKISHFVTQAIEERIIEEIIIDPVEEFLNLRKTLLKVAKKDIKTAIEKGRM